jgi:ribose 5-phosphate isomerase B
MMQRESAGLNASDVDDSAVVPLAAATMPAKSQDKQSMADVSLRVGIAADHGGFELKEALIVSLRSTGVDILDLGAFALNPGDDYPDYIIPLAMAVASGQITRGVALCGSGVGASIAANKIAGARAGLIHDLFSARQGVEDDDMNIICLGGSVTQVGLAEDLVEAFLAARFSGLERHKRRLAKIKAVEARHLG